MSVLNALLKAAACSLTVAGLLSAPAFAQIEYSAGHGDIGIEFLGGGELEPHWHFENEDDDTVLDGVVQIGQPEVEYEADEVYARVPDLSIEPSPAPFAGTGSIYVLEETESQASADNAPYLGIGLEELDAANWPAGIDLTFAVDGPGDFSLWRVPTLSPPAVDISTIDGDLSVNLDAGAHTHFNWGFTDPGVYEISITADGTDAAGAPATGTATYLFVVGSSTLVPEPGSMALVSLGLSALAIVRRKRA
ncbi:MAG: choice-of-anchor M domain-containing protein [Planctomycetota bacterium]